jgi:hypothetical protein
VPQADITPLVQLKDHRKRPNDAFSTANRPILPGLLEARIAPALITVELLAEPLLPE